MSRRGRCIGPAIAARKSVGRNAYAGGAGSQLTPQGLQHRLLHAHHSELAQRPEGGCCGGVGWGRKGVATLVSPALATIPASFPDLSAAS